MDGRYRQTEDGDHLLIGICFAGPIVGYPLTAALMSLMQMDDTRIPSMVTRFAVAAIALFALWRRGLALQVYRPMLVTCVIVFWTLYVARIVDDAYIDQMPMPVPPIEMLAMAFIFALIPALPGLIGLTPESSRSAYRAISIMAVLALLCIFIDSQRILTGLLERELGRFQLDKLNPLGLSTAGGLLVLLGIVGTFKADGKALGTPKVLQMSMLGGGLLGLLLGASRGPMLACAIALLIYAGLPFRAARFIIAIVVGVALSAVAYLLYSSIATAFSFDILDRIAGGLDGREESANLHMQALLGGIEQFLSHPLLGDTVVEKITQYYVHNGVVEALMATGLVGGLAYGMTLVMALSSSIAILRRGDLHGWLALACIYYAVLAQTGGAHFGFGPHWLTMLAAVATDARTRQALARSAVATAAHSVGGAGTALASGSRAG
ncbi:MAG: hypothetical protein AB7G13_05645 [Lautropia sp.]